MSSVKTKDTGPEVMVRKVLHASGYRYRLHRTDLPGRPDIVLPRFNLAMFVHGCFWHGHVGCPKGRLPKSRLDYWKPKISENRNPDQRVYSALAVIGWRAVVIWQCQTKDPISLAERVDYMMHGYRR